MKMGHCVAVLAAILAVGVVDVLCQKTTQTEIDRFARETGVQVKVSTNHDSRKNYEITILLFNLGRSTNLQTKDWKIKFNLKSRDMLVNPNYVENGLKLSEEAPGTYTIEPQPMFAGIPSRSVKSITIEAKGLSVYSSDVYPRFVFTADGLIAKNIANTDTDDVRTFVTLNKANNTFDDASKINGVFRNLQKQSFRDHWHPVPPYTIPEPRMLESAMAGGKFDFSNITGSTLYIVQNSIDNTLGEIARKLKDRIALLPGWDATKTIAIVNSAPANDDKIVLTTLTRQRNIQLPPNDGEFYELIVRSFHVSNTTNTVEINAFHYKGFMNALFAIDSILGEFSALPNVRIYDSPDFEIRSFKLDLTKNMVSMEELKMIIKLMGMVRLNELVLVLADNNAWRIEMDNSLNFNELTEIAGHRCMDESQCLPPRYGSGANKLTSGSGFLTRSQYGVILKEAKKYNINIVPYFNILGGMWAAKQASRKRTQRLGNNAEARRLDIVSSSTDIPFQLLPEDEADNDGLLDLCRTSQIGGQTNTFIKGVIQSIKQLYDTAGLPMKYFHAGGDSTTFYHSKLTCRGATGKNFMEQIMRDLITLMPTGTQLRVHEEAVIDPSTKTCLTFMGKEGVVVDFHKISVGLVDDWNLTPAQWAFIDRDPSMGNQTQLVLERYTGQKLGLAPWAAVYDCANKGYKVTMSPRGILSLDSAEEIDFDATGNRGKRSVFRTDMMSILNLEPFNIHMNMDFTDDHYPVNSYQMCKVFECTSLTQTGMENILGLAASLDTSVIRSSDQLQAAIAPRLLAFAERAWKRPAFEGVVRAEQPNTLSNMTLVSIRSQLLMVEAERFMNNFAYKEKNLLDAMGFKYNIERPGAAILNTLDGSIPPPFPTMVRVTIPGAIIEYKEAVGTGSGKWKNAVWKQLFFRDAVNRTITGRYKFPFPPSQDPTQIKSVLIRVTSSDGNRGGLPTLVEGTMNYLYPRNIPSQFKEGTCLPVQEDWLVNVDDITDTQWNKIFQNVASINAEQKRLDDQQESEITRILANTGYNYTQVSEMIAEALATNQMDRLPATNLAKRVFTTEIKYRNDRQADLTSRVAQWERDYQSFCPKPSP